MADFNELSYSLGASIGLNLKAQDFTIDSFEDFIDGLKAGYKNENLKIDSAYMNEILTKAHQEKEKMKHEEKIKEGEDFLAENAKKEGITVLESGLQYEVIKAGNGEKPQLTSEIVAHYHGTFINGDVFDSSIQRGTPATFPVNGVIAGWTEALQLMNTGSKWKLYVPYELAYGERGAGNAIPPFTTLIFEVELLEIK